MKRNQMKKVITTKQLLEKYDLDRKPGTVSLDLGCGFNPRNPLSAEKTIGIDILEDPYETSESISYIRKSIGNVLPLDSQSVDVITAYDFLEHIPRISTNSTDINPFIQTMNEIYRILKPGGFLLALTPCYPHPASFVDPTHVNHITRKTHNYFAGSNAAKNMGYGFTGQFKIIKIVMSSPEPGLDIWSSFHFEEESKQVRVTRIKRIWRFFFYNFKYLKNKLFGHSHIIWFFQK
jgi:SAM-dependent methyltransferase